MFPALAAFLLATAAAWAQESAWKPLFDPGLPAYGWSFGRGEEFPGAQGGLAIDEAVRREGAATLRLARAETEVEHPVRSVGAASKFRQGPPAPGSRSRWRRPMANSGLTPSPSRGQRGSASGS
jgi:hypothetical protein